MQNVFNALSVESFQRRMASAPKRQRMTTEEERKAYAIRHRREEIEEGIRLRRELEGF